MSEANEAQRVYWNSPVGERWVTADSLMGELLAAVLSPILERVALSPGDAALDIGCGSGALTAEVARRVAPGRVTAVDVSRPLLALARERVAAEGLTNVAFVEADAQDAPFEEGAAAAVVSRFGTMFFGNPEAAFANLRRALAPGGRLSIAAWGPVAQSPWFALPRAAAVDRLGHVPMLEPRSPGPFAFDDADYLAGLLTRAGFEDVAVDPVAVTLSHTDGEAVIGLATFIGPAAAVIREREANAEDVEAIRMAIGKAFAPFRQGEGIAIPAVLHVGSGRQRG
jgi:ubiquinone/menaquinone biosynthesis C-methylase UbiE